MRKYATQQVYSKGDGPAYRIQNNTLHIREPQYSTVDSVRVNYYPRPASLTVPQVEKSYTMSSLIGPDYGPVFYTELNGADYLLYVVDGTDLRVKSEANGTDILLFASLTSIENVAYFDGKVYIFEDGDVLFTYSDLSVLIVSWTTAVAAVDSASFNGDRILYTTATETRMYRVSSAADSLLFPAPYPEIVWTTHGLRWIDGGLIAGTTIGADALLTDGETLYYLDGDDLYTEAGELVSDEVYVHPLFSGTVFPGWLALPAVSPVLVISLDPDVDITYPNNLLTEILSVMIAIDFKIKQAADTSALGQKLGGLMLTLDDTLKRDEYTVARIGNVYPVNNWGY
jgi:hypothetical protein